MPQLVEIIFLGSSNKNFGLYMSDDYGTATVNLSEEESYKTGNNVQYSESFSKSK